MKIFRRKVKQGSKTGNKIGYPTINLNIGSFADHYKSGVYKCEVILDNASYIGALYFGSKLSHKSATLEIHIIKYNGHIYGQYVRLKVGKQIRGPKKFTNLDELKKQIGIDLKSIV
jgi:riboflavin kinase/FMN adenylyltransferase